MRYFPRTKDITMLAPPPPDYEVSSSPNVKYTNSDAEQLYREHVLGEKMPWQFDGERSVPTQIAKMAMLTEDDLRARGEKLSYAEADAHADALASSTLDGAEALPLLASFRELAPPGSKLRDALSFAHSTLSALADYPDHARGAFDLGVEPKDVRVERAYERVVSEDEAEKLSPGMVLAVRKTEASVLKVDPERIGLVCRLHVYTQQRFQGGETWASAGLLLSTFVDGKIVHAGYCGGSGITEALSNEFLDWLSMRPKTIDWWNDVDVKEATP